MSDIFFVSSCNEQCEKVPVLVHYIFKLIFSKILHYRYLSVVYVIILCGLKYKYKNYFYILQVIQLNLYSLVEVFCKLVNSVHFIRA